MDGIAALLCTPARPTGLPVELVDLSPGGARVRVANELDLRLGVGGAATLAVVHSSGVEVRLDGRLVSLHEQPGVRALALRFDEGAAERLLHPRVAGLFNHRSSFRVAPSSAEPIVASLVVSEPRTRPAHEVGRVLDLSTGGIGVEVSASFERFAVAAERVRCVLTLPGSSDSHDVPAVIRDRLLVPSGKVRYGLSFALGATQQDRRFVEAVLAYVIRRQAEIGAQARRAGPSTV